MELNARFEIREEIQKLKRKEIERKMNINQKRTEPDKTHSLFSNRRMGLEEADWPHRERVYWFV
jgi:hypothetical protein